MNGRRARSLRREARTVGPSPWRAAWGAGRAWKAAAVVLAAAVVAATFVTPALRDGAPEAAAPPHGAMAATRERGAGLEEGSPVPVFAERDVVSGRPITSASVRGNRTLLFFSEGVMCQACFEQIRGLERVDDVLERRGIQLVSITPDPPPDLRQAIAQYGITTPVISDADRDMSEAFNTLGQGMHGDAPGHAFVLVEDGKVVWQRDYWLPPDRTMYVEPGRLLDEIPSA